MDRPGEGLERKWADQPRVVQEVQQTLAEMKSAKDRQRQVHNARVSRASRGTRVRAGDLTLVKEGDHIGGGRSTPDIGVRAS